MDAKPHRVPLDTIGEHPAPPEAPSVALDGPPLSGDALKEKIIEVLKTCYDPELPLDIYQLGLVYGIDISAEQEVVVRMTLTSPACPVAGTLPGDVQRKLAAIPGVKTVKVDLVWEPTWDPTRLSDEARLTLGLEF